MNIRAFNRLAIYLIQSACTFALAGWKEEMSPYVKTLFCIGLILNLANTVRSFIDTSVPPPKDKPNESPPPNSAPNP